MISNNLSVYPVGSLQANVQGQCLIDVIHTLVSSDAPQSELHSFSQAMHEVFAFGRSKKHLIQRQLGRLEPTSYLKYWAKEVLGYVPHTSAINLKNFRAKLCY